MKPENLKPIRRTVRTCWIFCALTICYIVYNAYIRRHGWPESFSATKIADLTTLEYIASTIRCLLFVFIMVFLSVILQKLKHGQIFTRRNHMWLFASAASTFVLAFCAEAHTRIARDFDFDWSFIFCAVFKPHYMDNMVGCLLLILFALLYKTGEQLSEDQKLTI